MWALACLLVSGGSTSTSTSGSTSGSTPAQDIVGTEKCCEILDDMQSSCGGSKLVCTAYSDSNHSHHGRMLSGPGPVGAFQGEPATESAILFAVLALVTGVVSEKLLATLHTYGGPSIPYTAFILVVGLLTRIIAEGKTYRHFACSFHTWEKIDGHLLLYLFLPPLVFGDAMNLDWNVLKNCLGQCALLAFPGVGLGAVLFACIMKGVIASTAEWSWNLSLAFGAVMSATDPVAVVGLLKELGAPDSLTMIIGGESLLNDGMAMIVWAVRHPASCRMRARARARA